MSTAAWKLNGTACADLNVDSIRLALMANAASTLSFICHRNFDADQPFAHDDDIVLTDADGNRRFAGRVKTITPAGSPQGESIAYEIADAFDDLDGIDYAHEWAVPDGTADEDGIPEIAPDPVLYTHLILFQSITGAQVTVADEITAIVTAAVAGGCYVQLGEIDADVQPPPFESGPLRCLAAIQLCLRFCPDRIASLNFASDPPTFNVIKTPTPITLELPLPGGAGVAAANAALNGGRGPVIVSQRITPRHDLVKQGVRITYRIFEQLGTFITGGFTNDDAGTIGDWPTRDDLWLSCDIAGPTYSYAEQKVACSTIDVTDIAWWKLHVDSLADPAVTISAHKAPTGFQAAPTHERELTGGDVPDWARARYGLHLVDEVIGRLISFEYTDPTTGAIQSSVFRLVTARIKSTDAVNGSTLHNWTPISLGDSIPTGLAPVICDAIKVLQHDGQVVLKETEYSALVTLENSLNLANSIAAHATMNARITQIAVDVDRGQSTITIGPAPHLELDQLIELQRLFRNRKP